MSAPVQFHHPADSDIAPWVEDGQTTHLKVRDPFGDPIELSEGEAVGSYLDHAGAAVALAVRSWRFAAMLEDLSRYPRLRVVANGSDFRRDMPRGSTH